MNTHKYLIILGAVVAPLIIVFSMVVNSLAADLQYTVTDRPDGGYTIKIECKKRIWRPITAEGFFPVHRSSYVIEFKGKGVDWTFRNAEGYYYSFQEIVSKDRSWDLGYAWVDLDRKYLYLSLFWAIHPDDVKPHYVNGRYRLDGKKD
ncbi:MAG: hypothetical protein HPY65_03275 [Syntrophaceae bacterium]|nr:hypothetical protein [Syntrophaceae bacterium]